MAYVLSEKMRKFFDLIKKFAEGADEDDHIMITIELHIAGTAKTLEWDIIEKANLVKDAVALKAKQPTEPEQAEVQTTYLCPFVAKINHLQEIANHRLRIIKNLEAELAEANKRIEELEQLGKAEKGE